MTTKHKVLIFNTLLFLTLSECFFVSSPVRAKALYIRSFKAFALTGVLDNFKRTGRYFSR